MSVAGHEEFVAVSDGVKLDVSVFVPAGEPPGGGWPAVVFVHGFGGSKTELQARNLAERGYVGLAYSVRGQGRSGGASTILGDRERADLREIIDWLKRNYPVDGGRVGVTGGSQGGAHSWIAAAYHMGVRTVVPLNFGFPLIDAAIVNNCLSRKLWDPIDNPGVRFHKPLHERLRRLYLAGDIEALREWGEERGDVDIQGIDVPVMTQAAWEDVFGFAGPAIKSFSLLRGPKMIYVGTGGHGTPAVPGEMRLRNELRQRWLDYWLKGEDTGITREKPVLLSLLDTWEHVGLDEWPPRGLKYRRLYLRAGGRLSPEAPAEEGWDTLGNRPVNPEYGVEDLVRDGFDPGRLAEALPQKTVNYRFSPAGEFLLLGPPRVSLQVTGTAPRFQVVAQLYDEQGGRSRIISRAPYGVREEGAGGTLNLWFDLSPTGWRVRTGHTLRLQVTNIDIDPSRRLPGYRVRTIPYFDPCTTKVHHSKQCPSYIEIPTHPPM